MQLNVSTSKTLWPARCFLLAYSIQLKNYHSSPLQLQCIHYLIRIGLQAVNYDKIWKFCKYLLLTPVHNPFSNINFGTQESLSFVSILLYVMWTIVSKINFILASSHLLFNHAYQLFRDLRLTDSIFYFLLFSILHLDCLGYCVYQCGQHWTVK